METPTPTPTRRPMMVAARTGFSSVRMMEAQCTFQSVVKQELQLLLVEGMKREDAVKLLLRRIVASTEPPEAMAVRGVMRQFQMNYEDAMRALIVKQELGRLKGQGLDSFAAIEELTRKMKNRTHAVEKIEERDEEGEREEGGGGGAQKKETAERKRGEEEMRVQLKGFCGSEEKDEDQEQLTLADKEDGALEDKEIKKRAGIPAAEMASPTSEKDGNDTSLSLCQRIGQVSISSSDMPEKESEEVKGEGGAHDDTDGEENGLVRDRTKAEIKSPLRVRSPVDSKIVDLTPKSRKRRAAFGIKYESGSNHCNSSGERNVKSLFPNLKKQKVCAAVGDGFLQIVTLKSKSTSANTSKNTSTAGISGSSPNGEKGGGSMRSGHNAKNVLKRQRVSPTGMADNDEYPITEELRVSHVHHRHHTTHHHSKRQKSGSTH